MICKKAHSKKTIFNLTFRIRSKNRPLLKMIISFFKFFDFVSRLQNQSVVLVYCISVIEC